MKFTPETYQESTLKWMQDRDSAALWMDCGLGKTVTTLTALVDWFGNLEVKGVLIVAPLRVARITWPMEIEKWSHTKGLTFSLIHGDKGKAMAKPATIYLINYEGLIWLAGELKKMKPEKWPFDAIVFDESTKMKNARSKRFKAFKPLLPHFKKRIGLTGTPMPKGLLDLFGQCYCLDAGERLGKAVTAFENRYFESDFMGYTLTPRPGAEKIIHEKVADLAVQLKSKDHLDLIPPVIEDVELSLDSKDKVGYAALERDFFIELGDTSVEAFNAAALTNKCLQYASGAMYHDIDSSVRETIHIHDKKIKALQKIREMHKGEPVILAYNFQHEAERLKGIYPDAVHLKSGMKDSEELAIQKRWDKGLIKELIVHCQSAGHGLNLQYGGRIIIWLSLNWSYELYYQLNKRVDRKGQNKQPLIYRLIVSDTLEEAVATSLGQREHTQENHLAAIKAYKRGYDE